MTPLSDKPIYANLSKEKAFEKSVYITYIWPTLSKNLDMNCEIQVTELHVTTY